MNERDGGRQTREGGRSAHHPRTNSNIDRSRSADAHRSSEDGYSGIDRNTSSYSHGMHRSEGRDFVRHNYQEGHHNMSRQQSPYKSQYSRRQASEGGRWGQRNDSSYDRGEHRTTRPTFMNDRNDRHGGYSNYGSSHYQCRQNRMQLRGDSNNDRKRSADPQMNQYSERGYCVKRQNTNSSSETKRKEEQLKEEINEQMEGHPEYYSSQVFIRREGWEEKLENAAKTTKKYVLPKLKEKLATEREWEEDCVSDPDASDDSSVKCGGNPGPAADKFEIDRVSKFIDALPRCRLLDLGFHISCKDSGECFITML